MTRWTVAAATLATLTVLTGCGAPEPDRTVEARAAVDAVYAEFSEAMLAVDGYDDLADGVVADAVENCATVGLYLSGINGDELLEDAFLAAVDVVCD